MQRKRMILSLLTAILVTLCFAQAAPDFGASPAKKGSIGIGYGIPYGGLGVNGDVFFGDNLALTVGIGSFGYTAGYELGAKYFYGSPAKTWRPLAVVLYGINGVLMLEGETQDIREAFSGISAGLGSQFLFGKNKHHGFDLGVLYILTSGVFKRMEELEDDGYSFADTNRFSCYLGYRYAFNLKF